MLYFSKFHLIPHKSINDISVDFFSLLMAKRVEEKGARARRRYNSSRAYKGLYYNT